MVMPSNKLTYKKVTMEAKKNYTSSLIILTTLFFMWGFLTCMNDILIPYLKEIFVLKYWQAMLIQFCFLVHISLVL